MSTQFSVPDTEETTQDYRRHGERFMEERANAAEKIEDGGSPTSSAMDQTSKSAEESSQQTNKPLVSSAMISKIATGVAVSLITAAAAALVRKVFK